MKKVFFLPLLFLIGCAPSNKIQSERYASDQSISYKHYDKDSKIRYFVSNDNKNVFIRLNAFEKETIESIVRGGLTIYFDPTGKKKKDISLQYPLPPTKPASGESKRNRGQGRNNNDQGAQKPTPIGVKAIFKTEESIKNFNADDPNADIKLEIEKVGEEIFYDVLIPIKYLLPKDNSQLSKLSIGIKSNEIESSTGQSGPPNGGSGQTQGGRGQGGGRPEGGGSSGGGGGPSQGGPSSQAGTSIDFWFSVNLIK